MRRTLVNEKLLQGSVIIPKGGTSMPVNARRRRLVAKNSVDVVPSAAVGPALRRGEVLSPPVAAES